MLRRSCALGLLVHVTSCSAVVTDYEVDCDFEGVDCADCFDCAAEGPCKDELDACVESSSCGDVVDCIDACGADDACVLACPDTIQSATWDAYSECNDDECAAACGEE